MEHTKADQIASSLEEAIVAGAIEPGSVLRQDQISREYRVSRTPVREALRRLAALGMAEFLPNRGVRVLPLVADEWRDIYLARAALEGIAAELAAERITDVELAELEREEAIFMRRLEVLRTTLPDSEREAMTYEWLQANARFHDLILVASGSELIARLARSVRRGFVGRHLWKPGSEVDHFYVRIARQHTAIRQALLARSPQGARALSTEHVLDSWRLLQLILEESNSRRINGGPPAN